MTDIDIKAVDRVEITVLVDNYTDLFVMQSNQVVKRPPMPRGATPFAEHGLSLLIEATTGATTRRCLMDAALTPVVLLNNIETFQVDMKTIDGIVLSHGHVDHFGGLEGLADKTLPPDTKLIVHPDAFLPRRLNLPGSVPPLEMACLNESALVDAGLRIVESSSPSTWFDDSFLVTAEVKRTTDFEKGLQWAEIKRDNSWSVDPFYDDQGVALVVKGRGLVVVSGCSHAGIINTIEYIRELTGIKRVLAVLGGFHLTGPISEPLIEPTLEEMKRINPEYVIPLHCTGWKATTRFAAEMPDQFVLNTVGTKYVFD